MDDWIKKLIFNSGGGLGFEPEGRNRDHLPAAYRGMTADEFHGHIERAFTAGQDVAETCRGMIAKAAKELSDRGLAIDATIIIMVATWLLLDWARSGVVTIQKKGKTSPVTLLWGALEAAFTQDTPEEGIAALHQWAKDNGIEE